MTRICMYVQSMNNDIETMNVHSEGDPNLTRSSPESAERSLM